MNFRPPLFGKVLDGTKTVTRRPVGSRTACPYLPGRDYAVCPGRGKHQQGRLLVDAVDVEPVGKITDAEAVLEGFPDRDAFIDYWKSLYGGRWKPDELVFRIQFHLLSRIDVPRAEHVSGEAATTLTHDIVLCRVALVDLSDSLRRQFGSLEKAAEVYGRTLPEHDFRRHLTGRDGSETTFHQGATAGHVAAYLERQYPITEVPHG